jgi:phosphoribosylformylglycinamidine synthase subunit PurS
MARGAALALARNWRHRPEANPIPAKGSSAMKVRVFVSLKNGVLDPQGRAIHHAIEGLGIHGVNDVRAGKMIELDVDDSVTDDQLETMCKQLLANMVIENYRIERLAA